MKHKLNGKILKFIIIVVLPVTAFIILSQTSLKQENPVMDEKLLSSAYAAWSMDDAAWENIQDSTGKFKLTAVNVRTTKGKFKKAGYFNGKDSYIVAPINFKGWKALTISMWVKPERKSKKELSVVLDNGHDANNNFVIQSADAEKPNSGKWVWHCNGTDIFLKIPFNEWTHIMVVANAEKGIVSAYINGVNVGSRTTKSFEFNDTNLTIGKLSKIDSRYFKGSIDEIIILNRAL